MKDDIEIVKEAYDTVIEAVKDLNRNQRERVLKAVSIVLEGCDDD